MMLLSGKRGPGSPEILGLAGLLAVVAYPLFFLVRESFLWDGAFSFEAYGRVLSDAANYRALGRTLRVGLLTTLTATSLGTFLAWLCRRSDLGGRRRAATWAVFPFMVPPFIGAFTWGQLLGPVGYVNKLYGMLTGSDVPLFDLYSAAGIVFVMSMHLYPLAYLTMSKAFDQMDGALEEAARISGASNGRVALDVTIPALTPALVNAALLVFVAAVSNFGVPAALGFSNGYYVLTTRIFDTVVNFSLKNHFSISAALSVLLACLAGAGLIVANAALRGRRYEVVNGRAVPAPIVPLGRLRIPLTVLVWGFLLLVAVAPLAAAALTAVTKAYGLPPVPSNWSFKHIHYVLTGMPVARRAFRNSIALAFSASTLAALFAGTLAYAAERGGPVRKSVLEFTATIPYAVPGTVVALSMILAFNSPVFGLRLYNTLGIILIAYVARYLIFPMRSVLASLSRIAGDLEEAARIAGAGAWRRLLDVVIPVVKPGLVLGWFMVLIPTMHELTVSVLLWSAGNETLGVAVFTLQEAGGVQATSALALLTIGLVATTRWAAARLGGRALEV